MNLGEALKNAPALQLSLACALLLHFAPRLTWLPSEFNEPAANIGGIAALVAVVLMVVNFFQNKQK